MNHFPIFYLPVLHTSLAPQALPEDILFLPVGLEAVPAPFEIAEEEDDTLSPEENAARHRRRVLALRRLGVLHEIWRNLPLNPRAARATLDEMLDFSFTLGPESMLAASAPKPARSSFRDEMESLRAFSDTGKAPPTPQDDKPGVVSAADCQKVLLLAHELEARHLEMLSLELELEASEEILAGWLGEGPEKELENFDPDDLDVENFSLEKFDDSDFFAPFAPAENSAEASGRSDLDDLADLPDFADELADGLADDLTESFSHSQPGSNVAEAGTEFLPDWRLVLAAALRFLPEDAAIITSSKDMISHFEETGLAGPMPEEVKQSLSHWPEEFLHDLAWAEVPGWRLAGRARLQAERPWLSQTRRLILIRQPLSEA